MTRAVRNAAASVHQRLLNFSRKRNEDNNLILIRYGLERFLYRLANSEYADRFVLKGAMLFLVWTNNAHRPTKDFDLFGYGDDSAEALKALFQDVCRAEVEPDGITFDPDSVQVEKIREDQEYQGQRVKLKGRLGQAKVSLQVDIGFGDLITPEAQAIEYPTLLPEQPAPRIRAYSKESVVSEKFQAMITLGMSNSRMKDFYDLWIMSRQFQFKGETLARAIRATFERRGTAIPKETPLVFSQDFTTDRNKAAQWGAFLKKTGLTDDGLGLPGVVEELRVFLEPPMKAAAKTDFTKTWSHTGKWE